MANIAIPFAAVPQAQVPSAGFNANFTEIASKFNSYAVQTDVAKTITVAHTWAVAQNMAGLVMTGDLLFTDALYDIGKSGATRPRDLFLSRNLAVGGNVVSDLLFTDATFDIGKTGATRPRDLFLSRNLNVGSVITAVAANHRIGTLGGAVGAKASMNVLLYDTSANNWNGIQADINGSMVLSIGIATRYNWVFEYDGLLLLPGANTGASATAGDAILANNRYWRGVIAAGTDTKRLIGLNNSNQVLMDPDGVGTIHAGDLLFTDNLFDIGKTGATRPRDLFLSRNLTVGGIGTFSGSASRAGLNVVPSAGDPISPVDGDIWALTAGTLKARLNAATKFVQTSGSGNLIGLQATGYTNAWTGAAANRATGYDASTITLPQLAARVRALQEDLQTVHSLISV